MLLKLQTYIIFTVHKFHILMKTLNYYFFMLNTIKIFSLLYVTKIIRLFISHIVLYEILDDIHNKKVISGKYIEQQK